MASLFTRPLSAPVGGQLWRPARFVRDVWRWCLCLGIGGGVALMRVFRGMLYEIGPADPVTLAAVALLLLSAALSACSVPARRALRVDPVIALRDS